MASLFGRIKRGCVRASESMAQRKRLRKQTHVLVKQTRKRKRRTNPERLRSDLAAIGPQVAQSLLTDLGYQVGRQRRRTVFGVLFLIAAIGYLGQGSLFGALIAGILGSNILSKRPQKRYSRLLAMVDDPEACGYLAQGIWRRDRWARDASRQALEQSIQQLTLQRFADTKPAEWTNIYRALDRLTRVEDTTVVVSLLEQLTRLRDYAAYPYVERLVQRTPDTAQRMIVRKAAGQCADQLREGYERMQQSATLLRAAEAPAQQTLLRPASGIGAQDEQLLLRPRQGADDE